MKKIPLLCLSLCLGMVATLWGQDRKSEVHNNLETVGAFKRLDLAYDFKIGEEILLTVETLGGRKLNQVVVREPGSDMHMTARKVRTLERKKIAVFREGTFTFQFRNRGLFARKVNVKIEKNRRTYGRDTLILDDLIFSTRVDTTPKPIIDTIPVPDVSSHSIFLSPVLEVSGKGSSCIEEVLLEKDSFQFAVYWIGIGNESLAEYEKLKANPPPHWLIEAVNEPLIAFGLGLTERLPVSNNSLSKDVIFKFQDPTSKTDRQILKEDKRSAFYGFVPYEKATKFKKLKLCLRNFNTITGVPIHIKVAKFRIEKGFRKEVIIRERTQEIYIQKKIEDVEPEEE